MNLKEYCKYLNISEPTIYNWKSDKPNLYKIVIEYKKEKIDNENNLTIIQNRLDILPFLWQNIVLEVPMRITNSNIEDVVSSGEGWELINEKSGSFSFNIVYNVFVFFLHCSG